jgi:hypothetical protein
MERGIPNAFAGNAGESFVLGIEAEIDQSLLSVIVKLFFIYAIIRCLTYNAWRSILCV